MVVLTSSPKASQRSTSLTPKLKANGNSLLAKSSPKVEENNNIRNGPQSRPTITNPMMRTPRIERRNEQLYDIAIKTARLNDAADDINIRGIAGPVGPFIVIGQNFAPGTTAADIESAMEPNAGPMQSCRILSSSPTVIAEMVFAERDKAETVISVFNNRKVCYDAMTRMRSYLTLS